MLKLDIRHDLMQILSILNKQLYIHPGRLHTMVKMKLLFCLPITAIVTTTTTLPEKTLLIPKYKTVSLNCTIRQESL
eukprot:UN28941